MATVINSTPAAFVKSSISSSTSKHLCSLKSLKATTLKAFPRAKIRASSSTTTTTIIEAESGNISAEKVENIDKSSILACPICYNRLTCNIGPDSTVTSTTGSSFQCNTCKKSYFSNESYLDLTIASGTKEYSESTPASTEIFRTPLVSYLYERGWRQNFIWGGFPGPEKEFEMAKGYLKPVLGGNIVDASCGSGLFSRLFAKSGLFSLVVALDFSENMLQQCSEFIKQEKNFPEENLTLVRADISRLPFVSSSVDAVHAGAALHCWPSPSSAVSEISRVLKPGGVFVATTYILDGFFLAIPGLRILRQYIGEATSSHIFLSERELEDLCKGCGLVGVTCVRNGIFIMLSATKPRYKGVCFSSKRSSKMADMSPQKKLGCASMVYGGLFRHRFWAHKRSPSTSTYSSTNGSHIGHKSPNMMSSKRRRGSDETGFLEESDITAHSTSNQHKNPTPKYPNSVTTVTAKVASVQAGSGYGKRVPKESIGLSGELNSMINDHQQAQGSNNLVRASSSNVMLFGNLGNLRQPGTGMSNTPSTATNVMDHLPKTAREKGSSPNRRNGNGNVVTGTHEPQEQPGSLCRVLSTRMDPEQLKAMGNEDYKNGRFSEALALYDRAIRLDPEKASYRSNKSAALTGLGRLLEAVFECREAIRIEPTYHRAHLRLATLCLRLGEAEKSLYHYKQAGPEASSSDISQAKSLQTHLNKCTEAKRLRDWNALLKESGLAISSGADSAPQIFGLQAEALLKLHRFKEADATLLKSPKFDTDHCTKFYGPIGYANILVTTVQVDMAIGRFENAVTVAQQAVRLDSCNKDVSVVLRKAKGVASARSNGNELFKASKFLDASIAYGEGLENDPLNSVLLCNRAACRSKLGQFEKAIEDCTRALNMRPSYSKARLRRADCNAKLERWEASVQDYEILRKEMPHDDEVTRGLSEAQAHIKKQHGGESKNTKVVESGVIAITSNEHFRKFVSSTSQGMSVVLFYNKSNNHHPVMNLMDQLCRKHPSFNFLKVEMDDHPQLSKSEGVHTLPVVKMYRDGLRIKEISGTNLELIESTVKFYNTT